MKAQLAAFAGLFLSGAGIVPILPVGLAQGPAVSNQTPAGTMSSKAMLDEQSSYNLSVTSQLVLLDVAVRDQRGQSIRHLTQNDFTIFQDGAPQPIVAFEAVDTTDPAQATPPIHSTEELEKIAQRSPVTILVLDELTTKFEDEYFARYSLKKYLGEQGDTLSDPTLLLARSYNRTTVLHDYTTSKREILDALERHLAGNDWRAKDPSQADTLLGAALASLVEVAKATEGHAGHKNVVWIGRGFPGTQWSNLTPDHAEAVKTAIVSCSNLLRDARITLYSLDPSGISVALESTADSNGVLATTDPFGGQIDFDKIAESTGGLAIHGRNDVDHMIEQAVEGGKAFYALAYRPPASSEDDPKKFHQIRVVMKNPQLIASSREGFYAESAESAEESAATGDLSHARSLDLAGAINGLMVFTGIPLEVDRKNHTNQYEVTFPAASVDLKETDGRLIGDTDLIVVSFDRKGKRLSSSGKVISLHLPPLPPDKIEDRKVTVTAAIEDVGSPARIRFVVRSHSSGRIGAENYFIADRNSRRDPSTGLKAARP